MKKLVIDDKTCLCCGCCEGTCSEVFGQSEEGPYCVKDQSKVEENMEAVENAIDNCPVGAISWEEE